MDKDRPSGIRGLRYDVQEVFLEAGTWLSTTRPACSGGSAPTDAVIVDPRLRRSAVLLTAEPRPTRPPVILGGVFPRPRPSAAVPPFGLGLQPLRNPVLNRVRNAGAAGSAAPGARIFGPVQRSADDMAREVQGRPVQTFVLDWASTVDAIAQFSVPAFEYPRPDATVPLHFVGPLTSPSNLPTPPWWGTWTVRDPSCWRPKEPSPTGDFSELIKPTVEALADEDVLVVVTTGGPPVEELGPLPARTFAPRSICPMTSCSRCLDLMVTNGGYGGVHYALAHSVPLVARRRR